MQISNGNLQFKNAIHGVFQKYWWITVTQGKLLKSLWDSKVKWWLSNMSWTPLYLSNFFLVEEENTSGAIILTKGGAWSKKWSHEGWTSGGVEAGSKGEGQKCTTYVFIWPLWCKIMWKIERMWMGYKKAFGSETFGIDFASFHDCHNKDARAKARRNFCGASSWGGEKGALSEGQRLYQVWGWVDLLDLKIWSF